MANKIKDLINKCKELMSRCLPIKNPSIDSDRTASVNDSRTLLSNSTLNDDRATWEMIADMTFNSLMDRNPQIQKETEKSQHILPDDITETTQINILQSEAIDPTYGNTDPRYIDKDNHQTQSYNVPYSKDKKNNKTDMHRQPENIANSAKVDGNKMQMSQ